MTQKIHLALYYFYKIIVIISALATIIYNTNNDLQRIGTAKIEKFIYTLFIYILYFLRYKQLENYVKLFNYFISADLLLQEPGSIFSYHFMRFIINN